MEIREYETVYVIAPNLSDEETQAVMDHYREIVETNQGKDVEVEVMGKRKLAYEIQKFNEGFYVILRYKTEGGTNTVAELERRMRNDEKIIRFLTVRLDKELKKPRKLEEKWKRKRSKLEEKKEQEKEGGEQ